MEKESVTIALKVARPLPSKGDLVRMVKKRAQARRS